MVKTNNARHQRSYTTLIKHCGVKGKNELTIRIPEQKGKKKRNKKEGRRKKDPANLTETRAEVSQAPSPNPLPLTTNKALGRGGHTVVRERPRTQGMKTLAL